MKPEITIKVVRTNGQININETLGLAQAALVALNAEEENDQTVIGEAVKRVFEETKSKSMNFDALISFTFSKLSGVEAGQFGMVGDRVRNYVRGATDLFHVGKGKGGGVQYLPHLSAEELSAVEEQRQRAAEKSAKAA